MSYSASCPSLLTDVRVRADSQSWPRSRNTAMAHSTRRSQLAGSRMPRRALSGLPSRDDFMFLENGEMIALPKRRQEPLQPHYDYSKEQVIELHLQALKHNDEPYPDHGIEVLYRFADLDPFQRSRYFGRLLDLGQFERFRRVLHAPAYAPLLRHTHSVLLSSLTVADNMWKQRVAIMGAGEQEERIYEFTLTQRLGGHYDGYWFASSLICDGVDLVV